MAAKKRKARSYEHVFAQFVDDMGGFLWAIKSAKHTTWEKLGKEVHLAPTTLLNLANRVTKNPQMYTCWCILRRLDNSGIIRHSQLEQYRGMASPKAPKKRRAA